MDVGEALLIERCGSVHTVGMRFALDLVFLDRGWRVVRVARNVGPGRWMVWGAAMAVTDKAKLEEVLSQIDQSDAGIRAMIEEISEKNKLFRETDQDGQALDILAVSLNQPTHAVNLGDAFTLCQNVLVCASPITDVFIWSKYLSADTWFLPYPTPLSFMRENTNPLVGVTSSTFIAGHILYRWAEMYGEESIGKE